MFHVYFECMVFTCWIILSKSHIRSSFRQHFSFSKSIWAVLLCSTARAPFFTSDTFIMTSSRLHFYVPPLYLNKLAWSLCLGGIWHFTLCISHLISTVKLSTQQALPWTLKKKDRTHSFQQERDTKEEVRDRDSQRVKPKYYYTCYNSLLFQWQRSWSEGDFITLQVIASYIKLGLPQFLGSRSVWLTVKLTAFHHRVIRLACWLCIKQEQTVLAALLRFLSGTRTVLPWLGHTGVPNRMIFYVCGTAL